VVLQTRSLVNEIEIEGATRISPRACEKGSTSKSMAAERRGIAESARQIVEAYQAKGFTDVDVNTKSTRRSAGTSRVIYTITEGTRARSAGFVSKATRNFRTRFLRKQMKTKGKTLYSFIDKSGRLDETQLEQDVNAVKEYYRTRLHRRGGEGSPARHARKAR